MKEKSLRNEKFPKILNWENIDFLSVLELIDLKKSNFEVKIPLKRNLVAQGGEKGQNFILTIKRSFICHSKALD